MLWGYVIMLPVNHIVDMCPSTMLDGGHTRLHEADDYTANWQWQHSRNEIKQNSVADLVTLPLPLCCQGVMKDMETAGVTPDIDTFNSALLMLTHHRRHSVVRTWSLQLLNEMNQCRIGSTCFLDQELIPYHYSSCCCCCSYWGDALWKSLRLLPLKSDRDEIWRECSSRKYASIDRVGFLIWYCALSRWRPWRTTTTRWMLSIDMRSGGLIT